jgi:hypothetical protein
MYPVNGSNRAIRITIPIKGSFFRFNPPTGFDGLKSYTSFIRQLDQPFAMAL